MNNVKENLYVFVEATIVDWSNPFEYTFQQWKKSDNGLVKSDTSPHN